MTLVEGIGDEVIQFFGILFVILLGFVAWWSTNISDIPVIRTVLILERRSQTVSNLQGSGASEELTRLDTGQVENEGILPAGSVSETIRDSKSNLNATNSEPASQEESSPNGHSNIQNEDELNQESRLSEDSNPSEDLAADSIRIRLKYFNDDQKLVQGRLQEQLGDFKRRHFRMELSAQKLVRLIFNGQVLRDDQTLQGCGLYDNCVVHCLFAQRNLNRPPGQQPPNTSPPDWNLGGLLYFSLSVIIAFAWVCRYNYSHLFSSTTTAALAGLTGLFAGSVVGLYMPEQESTPRT